MIPQIKMTAWILESLENVRQSEPVYQDVALDEGTILLGPGTPFDSIAFTAFAVGLEEKIEKEAGIEFALEVAEIFNPGEGGLSVRELSKRLERLVAQAAEKSA